MASMHSQPDTHATGANWFATNRRTDSPQWTSRDRLSAFGQSSDRAATGKKKIAAFKSCDRARHWSSSSIDWGRFVSVAEFAEGFEAARQNQNLRRKFGDGISARSSENGAS